MRILRWVGSGNSLPDAYCFPGNLIRWIYLLEKATMTAVAAAPGPQVGSAKDDMSDAGFMTTFLKPYVELGLLQAVKWFHEQAKDFETAPGRPVVYFDQKW